MRQQKCLAHLLKNISMVLETKVGSERRFGVELKSLLREAIAVSKVPPGPLRSEKVEDLDIRLTWHLRDRILKDHDNQRLLNGVGEQMDRGRILTFLQVPGVEPTNNRAERMLRPAVIARKVSHCSKNARGAYATAAFLSVIQTARKGVTDAAPS
jgi:transposase